MRRSLSVRCSVCNHPAKYHHRASCDGRYLQPFRFTSSDCTCHNPLGLSKRHRRRRRSGWRDIRVSTTTVHAIGVNSLVATLILATMWILELF